MNNNDKFPKSEDKFNLLTEKIKEAREKFENTDSHLIFFHDDQSGDALFDIKGNPYNINLAICRSMTAQKAVRDIIMGSVGAWLRQKPDMKKLFVQAISDQNLLPGIN